MRDSLQFCFSYKDVVEKDDAFVIGNKVMGTYTDKGNDVGEYRFDMSSNDAKDSGKSTRLYSVARLYEKVNVFRTAGELQLFADHLKGPCALFGHQTRLVMPPF